MRAAQVTATIVLLLAGPSVSRAQDAAPEPPAEGPAQAPTEEPTDQDAAGGDPGEATDSPANAAGAPEADAPLRDDASMDRLFSDGIAQLARGDYESAARAFDTVASGTVHAARRQDAERLAGLARELAAARPDVVYRPVERPSDAVIAGQRSDDNEPGSGRSRVVVSSTLAGLYTGVSIAVLSDADDARAVALLATGLGGLGFAVSLASSRGIRSVEADAYSLGLQSGLGTGIALAVLGDLDGNSFLMPSVAAMFGYGALGLVAGGHGDVTRGDVAHTGTLAFNGAISGITLAVLLGEDTLTDEGVAGLILATGSAGLVAGAALAPRLNWSRRRVLWVDGASLLGGLLGLGTGVFATPDGEASNEVISTLVLGGLWAGYGAGVYFTRDVAPDATPLPGAADQPDDTTVSIVPMVGENTRGLSLAGTF